MTEKKNVFNTNTEPHESGDRSSGSEKDFDHEKTMYVGELEESEMRDEETVADPYEPFNDIPEERKTIVTIRAMLVGCICGALVNASNVYLGLKTGWTFGANLFGAIIGFAVLKPLGRKLPEKFPIFGGEFGPRENNIVQTAATAAGGLSSVFVSGIPALYQLGLLSTPEKDFSRLITLTIVGGYFGFAASTPREFSKFRNFEIPNIHSHHANPPQFANSSSSTSHESSSSSSRLLLLLP